MAWAAPIAIFIELRSTGGIKNRIIVRKGRLAFIFSGVFFWHLWAMWIDLTLVRHDVSMIAASDKERKGRMWWTATWEETG